MLVAFCIVHCQIGSLEMRYWLLVQSSPVHCQIGSLEIIKQVLSSATCVHCQIGSLENGVLLLKVENYRSLPDRQLRNLEK